MEIQQFYYYELQMTMTNYILGELLIFFFYLKSNLQ